MIICCLQIFFNMGRSRGGKSQVAIGFLKNTGTDPLKEQLDPLLPIAFRRRFDILFNVLPIVCGSPVFVFVLLCITLCQF